MSKIIFSISYWIFSTLTKTVLSLLISTNGSTVFYSNHKLDILFIQHGLWGRRLWFTPSSRFLLISPVKRKIDLPSHHPDRVFEPTVAVVVQVDRTEQYQESVHTSDDNKHDASPRVKRAHGNEDFRRQEQSKYQTHHATDLALRWISHLVAPFSQPALRKMSNIII